VKSVDRISTLPVAGGRGNARGVSGASGASAAGDPAVGVPAGLRGTAGAATWSTMGTSGGCDSSDQRVSSDRCETSDDREISDDRASSDSGATSYAGSAGNAGIGIPAVPASGTAGAVTYLGSERGTRARIARLILENGPVSAAALSARLGLTPAAVRRHLDNLLAGGLIEARTARRMASRGRGRPAKLFAITDAGRSAFEHTYDDLATSALRFVADVAGPEAVARFARQQVAELERRYRPVMEAAGEDKVTALAEALSADGYAASATSAPVLAAGGEQRGGEQLCQHHCPVAHVAAEFPQLCEAETEAFARLLGTPVQRLATIAHGDGICTTHVTAPALVHTRTTTTTSQPGGTGA
jgi:predicted ArsR family transcriptional regulator